MFYIKVKKKKEKKKLKFLFKETSSVTFPFYFLKLFMYQLFRSLAYIHSQGICHRDIKPQNLLLDPESATLKLCDFGSAKQLIRGELNVSYICSRYYRAPELIFGATDYTVNIGKYFCFFLFICLFFLQKFPAIAILCKLLDSIELESRNW